MKKIIFTVFCATMAFSNGVAMEEAFVQDKSYRISTSQVNRAIVHPNNFEKQLINYKRAFGICFDEVNPEKPFCHETAANIRFFSENLVEIYKNATYMGRWVEKKEAFEVYLSQIYYKNKLYNISVFL